MARYIVSDQEQGLSLLVFLSQKNKGLYSAKKIKKAIESKCCTVNDRQEFFPSRKLAEGDVVVFVLRLEEKLKDVEILFEDADYAIIDKPYNCVCEDGEIRKRLGPQSEKWHLVHRLDKDTSGLVLLAKNEKAHELGKKLFSQRVVQKIYLAIVDGRMPDKECVIDNFLGVKGSYEGQTLYGSMPEGKRAITYIKPLKIEKDFSVVLCTLKTGRTHQIRVHLSELGHPILGDLQYGKQGFCCRHCPKRHLLHAWKLSFIHPIAHRKVEVTAKIPTDFAAILKE